MAGEFDDYILSRDASEELRQALRKIGNIRIVGMASQITDESILIGPPYPPAGLGSDDDSWRIVRVRPTAAATKSGTYTGFIRNSPTGAFDSTAAGTLAASDFGSNGAAVTIINASEEGATGHELDFTGTYLPLEWIGMIIGTDTGTSNPLVMAFMDQSQFCETPPPP